MRAQSLPVSTPTRLSPNSVPLPVQLSRHIILLSSSQMLFHILLFNKHEVISHQRELFIFFCAKGLLTITWHPFESSAITLSLLPFTAFNVPRKTPKFLLLSYVRLLWISPVIILWIPFSLDAKAHSVERMDLCFCYLVMASHSCCIRNETQRNKFCMVGSSMHCREPHIGSMRLSRSHQTSCNCSPILEEFNMISHLPLVKGKWLLIAQMCINILVTGWCLTNSSSYFQEFTLYYHHFPLIHSKQSDGKLFDWANPRLK